MNAACAATHGARVNKKQTNENNQCENVGGGEWEVGGWGCMAGRVSSDGAMKPKAKVGREDNKLLLGF